MSEDHSPAADREHLWQLIRGIRFAMFTTVAAGDPGGTLHSRPMTTQNRRIDEDDSLWFFMSRRSDPVHELQDAPEVNVAYADPDGDRYVSVTGRAAVVDDRARVHALWNPFAEAWFPGGPDDPDLALVQVRIGEAEFWDVKASKVTQLFRMAGAAVTGRPPRDMGQHGSVRMR